MSTARFSAPTEGWSQQTTRAPGIFFDQHKSASHPDGRAWWCWTETPADPTHPRGIVGELIPITADLKIGTETIRGWNAPWFPEQKYVLRGAHILAGNRFRIDYPAMIADYVAANRRYYAMCAQECGAKNLPAPKLYGPVPFQIRALQGVGDPPKSPKLPEAAAAGDPWILGFSAHVNEQLARIIARETGQAHFATEEYVEPVVAPASESNPLLAGLTEEQVAGLLEMLQANKQAKAMREAKAARRASSDQAA